MANVTEIVAGTLLTSAPDLLVCRRCGGEITRLSTNQLADIFDRVAEAKSDEEAFGALGSAAFALEELLAERTRFHPTCEDGLVGVIAGAQLLEKFRAGLHLDRPEVLHG